MEKKKSFVPEGYINNAASVIALVVVLLIIVASKFITTPEGV